MNVEIEFVNVVKSAGLEAMVQEKLEKLTHKYEWITNAAVFLKEDKHPGQKNYECEIRLSVPGPQIFASCNETSFNKAIPKCIDELGRQLEKKKDKLLEKR